MYCILVPLFAEAGIKPSLDVKQFFLLCSSSIFVAAAGYIINDYFDLNIDRINKPHKLVIQKTIPRRWAIALHLILSLIGIAIGFYLDFSTKVTLLGFSNFGCVLFLFLYSIALKRKLLAGNILISLLTAWTVLVITWCEARFFFHSNTVLNTPKMARLTLLYAGFAFVISLIREVIKDMEDIEGDRQYGCKTMPILWGLNVSKVFVAVWLIVLTATLLVLQFYVLQFHWWMSAIWCVITIIIPLIWIFQQMLKAQSSADFHKLSSVIKLTMLTGILSMIFFRLYS